MNRSGAGAHFVEARIAFLVGGRLDRFNIFLPPTGQVTLDGNQIQAETELVDRRRSESP